MQHLAHLVLLDLRMGLANDLIPKTPILVHQSTYLSMRFRKSSEVLSGQCPPAPLPSCYMLR